jgi:hypothetical protein
MQRSLHKLAYFLNQKQYALSGSGKMEMQLFGYTGKPLLAE